MKLGYDRDHVIVLPLDDKMRNNLTVIKEQFKQNPDILSVSACSNTPVEGGGGFSMRSALMPESDYMTVTAARVDEDYVNTVGLRMITGRNFNMQDMKDVSNDDFQKNSYHFILETSWLQNNWDGQLRKLLEKKCF